MVMDVLALKKTLCVFVPWNLRWGLFSLQDSVASHFANM